jgi:biotin carboxylase
MSGRWLALVESNTTGTGRLFVRAARDLGFRSALLSADASRYDYLGAEEVEVVRVDTNDEEALLEACRRLADDGGLAGVTSSSEYFIARAAAVARRLDLRGPDPTAVSDCRDKGLQREHLREAGVGVPSFRVADSMAAALNAARFVGLPAVVKPVSGTGSSGVLLCHNLSEVMAHSGRLLEQADNERGLPSPRRVLVEQLAQGPEFSVETFGTEVIGVTRKHLGEPPHFVETGHDFPCLFESAEGADIERAAVAALRALNLTWGPAHTELRLTDEGPKIIEVNPRLAGGMIPELVRLSCGADLVSETIRAVTGRPRAAVQATRRFASIRFVVPASQGCLAAVRGLREAVVLPGVADVRVYARPGDRLERRNDFRDRVGHVIAVGETPDEAKVRAERALGSIKLTFAESAEGALV